MTPTRATISGVVKHHLRIATSLVSLSVIACGAAPTAPAEAPKTTPSASTEQVAALDLSPVPPPSSLLAEGHVSQRQALRDALDGVATDLNPDRTTIIAKDSGLSDLVVAAAPEHFVALLDTGGFRLAPSVRWVSSIGLSSWEEAERRLRDAGAKLTPLGQDLQWSDAPSGPCLLAKAPPPAPARFMCGPAGTLGRAAPYLARTLGREQAGPPEVLARIPVRALSEQHGPLLERAKPMIPSLLAGELRRDPDLARWIEPTLPTLVEEGLGLVADVHEITLRLSLEGSTVALESEAVLAGKRSWAGSTFRQARDTAKMPEAFSRLPKDADFAWFTSRIPDARAKELQQFVEQVLRAGLGPGASRDSVEVVAATFAPDAPMVYAHGDAFGEDAGDVRNGNGTRLFGGERLRRQMMSVYGWHIMAYDGPASEYLPRLVQGMNAYDSGDLRDIVYRQLPRLCPGLPQIKQRAPSPKLPKGSATFEMKLPGKLFDDCWEQHRDKSRDRAKDAALVVILVPDGERTWIGLSPDEAGLVERLTRAVSKGASLPVPTGLDVPGAFAGGVATLAGIGGMRRFVAQYEVHSWLRSNMAVLPHKGTTPIPFVLTLSKDDPLKVRFRAELTKSALEDLRARRQRSYRHYP